MKLYKFARLINKYSVTFTLHQASGGDYVNGRWELGSTTSVQMRGAIVPMSERKIYSSGGTYTAQDRELYLTEPLRGDLSDFTVSYNKNTYTVEEVRNFEDYADVAVYNLKWVSAGA